MTKPVTPVVSPTVAGIISDFLQRLESEGSIDKAAIERLSNALGEQKLDAESLRTALFAEQTPKS